MSSEAARKAVRESALILRKAIRNANIVFEGPVLPKAWPEAYAELFRRVYDYQEIRYTDSARNSDSISSVDDENRKRAKRLVGVASRCRQELASEAEWRDAVEHLIFHRFLARLNCSICGERLRRLKVSRCSGKEQNVPAKHLLKSVCSCASNGNANGGLVDENDAGTEYIIRTKLEALVRYFDEGPAGDHNRKPDRTFGLGLTKSLNLLLEERTDIDRHGPFDDNNQQLVYPFLVVEAKALFAAEGIEHAEAQTAFPIKTFLQLQAQFRGSLEDSIQPLVWFLAYDGDQVHVYGCMTDGSSYRIFDLWQGSMCSYHGALQLFEILDFICEWAVTKHRRTILKCLAGGREKRLIYTPTVTTQSVYNSAPSSPAPWSPGTPVREEQSIVESRPLDLLELQHEIVSDRSPDETSHQNLSESTTLPIQVFHSGSVGNEDQRAIVSHVERVTLVFHQITIPGDENWLRDWLSTQFADCDRPQFCARLQSLFSDTQCIWTSTKSVDDLREYWLGNTSADSNSTNEEQHCCLFLRYATSMNTERWQTRRVLECVVLTAKAIKLLSQELHTAFSLPTVHTCPCLTNLTKTFLACERKDAVYAALKSLRCHAIRRSSPASEHVSWAITDTRQDGALPANNLALIYSMTRNSRSQHVFTRSVDRDTSSVRPLPKSLQHQLCTPPGFASAGIIILKNSPSDNTNTNEIGIVVLRDSIYHDSDLRSRLLEAAMACERRGDLYFRSDNRSDGLMLFQKYNKNDRELERKIGFMRIFGNWVKAMRNGTVKYYSPPEVIVVDD